MSNILCVLYPDPQSGYPPVYPRYDLPVIARYAHGQTVPTPKGPLGFKPGELVGCVSGELGTFDRALFQRRDVRQDETGRLSHRHRARQVGRRRRGGARTGKRPHRWLCRRCLVSSADTGQSSLEQHAVQRNDAAHPGYVLISTSTLCRRHAGELGELFRRDADPGGIPHRQ